jgi:hypothetical protein
MTAPEPRLDKVHLLMEETGCDQGQAELALTSAGYDVEKAIRTIAQLLRHIVVVKCKFVLERKNLYGRLIWVGDARRRASLRVRAVVSYNPSLYETPLDEDWYEFEKSVYACRLWEGALQQTTQTLENTLATVFGSNVQDAVFDALRDGDDAGLRSLFRGTAADFFKDPSLALSARHEVLNLDQFRRIRSKDEPAVGGGDAPPASTGGETLALELSLLDDPDGTPADHLRPGDQVFVRVTDGRDLAQYLAKLLGGVDDRGGRPLAAPVEDIRRDGDRCRLQIRLSAGILGLAEVSADRRVALHHRAPVDGWRRWVPFLR